MLSGCSETNLSKEKIACESSPNLNGDGKDMIARNARQNAIFGIELSRKVSTEANSAWFGTGFLSDSLGRVAGTESINLSVSVKQLRTIIANQRAIELSLSMDGKNPLPSKAGWACEVLADSIASLNTSQSDEQFLESVGQVEAYFKRVYEINDGQNIEADLVAPGTMVNQQ